MKTTDVAIIGAGPTGLFAGFYAGMRGLSAVIIDKLEVPGGQLAALYPEKYIYDVAGFEEIKAQDLINQLMRQIKRFEQTTTFSLNNSIEKIEKQDDDSFIIKGSNEDIHAKAIIISAGNGAFTPRKLGLENEEKFNNIHYFVNDLNKFKNKKVAIFGGGDSAVDWAMMLTHIASEVSIIHRREEFRAHDHSVQNLKESDAGIYTPFVPESLFGNDKIVEKVAIKKAKSDEIVEIEVDDIICNFGFISNLGPIKEWYLDLDGNKIKVNSNQATNLAGIFAIGDICTYPGKAALIINGFGEAPIAINSVYQHLNPDAIIGALHSSSVIGGH